MTKLSKKEIDSILNTNSLDRIASENEIELIESEIKRLEKTRNLEPGTLTTTEINKIIQELGLVGIKVFKD